MSTVSKALSLGDESEVLLAISDIVWKKTEEDEHFQYLTDSEKTFLFIEILEGEVNNGGFDQFFFNSSGEYAHEILSAYENIGAHKTADIIYRAIQLFPSSPVPKDTEMRRELMLEMGDALSDLWDKLDEEFYRYEENIASLVIDFVERNVADFE